MSRASDDGPGHEQAMVSRLYRSVATERSPAGLDRHILQQAAKEAHRDDWIRWFIPWVRPAAFAATAGLSLALLLEFNDSGVFDEGLTDSAPIGTVTGDAASGFESATSTSSQRIREIGEIAAETAPSGDPELKPYSTSPNALTEERFCDDDASATPESWLHCIEALRESGLDAEAELELERLKQSYPEFTVPHN